MSQRYFKKNLSEMFRDLTSFGNPVILIILLLIFLGINSLFWKIILGLAFTEVLCSIIKILYYKERPKKEKYATIIEKIDAGSFPSIHTARATFIFLALFVITNTLLTKFTLLAMILIVGASRIILKKHRLQDVIMGAVIGAIIFILWREWLM